MVSRTLTVVLAGDAKRFDATLTSSEKRMQQFTKAIQVAAIGAGAALAGLGVASVRRSGEIGKLATAARLSVEEFQRLEAQAILTGGSADDLSDILREMTLRMQEAKDLGTGPAADALALLNLNVEDFLHLRPEQAFAKLRDAIGEVDDANQRLLLSEELLGGSSERLAGLLNLTADEYAELVARTDDLSVATQQQINATEDLKRELKLGLNEAMAETIQLTEDLGLAGENSAVGFGFLADAIDFVGDGVRNTIGAYIRMATSADALELETSGLHATQREFEAATTDSTTAIIAARLATADTTDQMDLYRDAVVLARSDTDTLAGSVAHLGGVYAELANAATVASSALAFADVLDPTVIEAAAQARSNAVLGNLGGVYASYLASLSGQVGLANNNNNVVRSGTSRTATPGISALEQFNIDENRVMGRGRSAGFSEQQIDQLASAFGRDEVLTELEKSAFFAETGFRSEVDRLVDQFEGLRQLEADKLTEQNAFLEKIRDDQLAQLELERERERREQDRRRGLAGALIGGGGALDTLAQARAGGYQGSNIVDALQFLQPAARGGGGTTNNIVINTLDPQAGADAVYDVLQELEDTGRTEMKVTAG